MLVWFDPRVEEPQIWNVELPGDSGVEGYDEGDDLDRSAGEGTNVYDQIMRQHEMFLE